VPTFGLGRQEEKVLIPEDEMTAGRMNLVPPTPTRIPPFELGTARTSQSKDDD
jgi:hypothetical protein